MMSMIIYYEGLYLRRRVKGVADNRPIGVFDSGLGGLTVLRELERLLPNESFVYFGDTGRVPYGTKSDETIKTYARQDEKFLLSREVKYIVAACGTVSAVAADTAGDLPVPFRGVVEDAVIDAVEHSENGKIGVIGTPATINNGAHKRLIMAEYESAEVINVACPMFVPLVEEGWFSEEDPVVLGICEKYLEPIIAAGCDTLILGCTHYPLLKKAIRKIVGSGVTLINMGVSTAEAVKNELTVRDMLNDRSEPPRKQLYVSDKTAAFKKVAGILLGENIDDSDVGLVDVSHYE